MLLLSTDPCSQCISLNGTFLTELISCLIQTTNPSHADIWDLSMCASDDHTDTKPFVRLLGHEADVHCVKLLLPLVISGSADATVREHP